MLTRMHLERFKGFRDAELAIGPFTMLIGANASGKSNLRDAFRFIHGISRGYTLADIIGEKWGEGGVLQWRGIRGGAVEATYLGADSFVLAVDFTRPAAGGDGQVEELYEYRIEVELALMGRPRVVDESLSYNHEVVFETDLQAPRPGARRIDVRFGGPTSPTAPRIFGREYDSAQPVLTQLVEEIRMSPSTIERMRGPLQHARAAIAAFSSWRFLDLSPEAMRLPSLPGQTTLGDRGENLSSVLQAIYEEPNLRAALLGWLRELTPMDVTDFEFPADQTGRILVRFIEAGGQRTSAYSASDGTLRFLAILAALLGPDPARLYFLEELENGLHPTRLALLLDLIESRVGRGGTQVVASTHSPQLLRLLSDRSRQDASLIFRMPGHSEGHIERLADLPAEAVQVIGQQDLGHLYESGWFENIMTFMADKEA